MSSSARIPSWKLERYRLGELPAAELASIKNAIAASPELQAEVAALEEKDASFLRENDPQAAVQRARAVESARRQNVEKRPTRALWTRLGIPGGILASLLVVFLSVHVEQNTVLEDRSKGLSNRLEIWKKTGDSAVLLLDSAQIASGDLIQIRIQPTQRCFGAVLSLDGRGHWTVHLPDTGNAAPSIEPGQKGFLPFSYQLDDAPRYEIFWFITSKTPFRVDSLMQNLQVVSGSPVAPPILPLDVHFTQTRIYLRK